jgi:putative cardiolipin synthase
MKNLFILIFFILTTFAFAGDPLLSDPIPYPYYDVQRAEDGNENYLTVLNSGIASFEKRLEMVRNAKDSVELEYFIYENGLSGKLMMQELVKAGKRGVKVRLLIDKSLAVVELNEFHAQELAPYNVEIRFYNAAPLIQVSTIQFRNHRKIMIADGKYAIVGGRNIGDDYFDMSPKYNFLDRDVYIDGPIVKTIEDSFNEYFEHKISERVKFPRIKHDKKIAKLTKRAEGKRPKRMKRIQARIKKIQAKYNKKVQAVQDFINRDSRFEEKLERISALGKKILAKTQSHLCPETTWSSDRPGGTWWVRLKDKYSKDYRYLRKTIADKVLATDKALYLSSPYLMNNGKSRTIMYKLLESGVKITAYTNSLSSTDATYVAANLYKDVYVWRKRGIVTHAHQGDFIPEEEALNEEVKKARWGTHSKTYLFETTNYDEFMISTYNIDNRSNHYNTELGLFCKGSNSLYSDVKDNMLKRISYGMEILKGRKAKDNQTGELTNRFGKHRAGLTQMRLLSLPSWLLKFLL